MPSEKKIEAGSQALKDFNLVYFGSHLREVARIVLTAAEQAEPATAARSGAVKVKPLVWRESKVGYSAETILGIWWVRTPLPDGTIVLECPYGPSVHASDEEAKAAAQADYEKRILAALEPAEPATNISGLLQQMREMAEAFAAMRNDLNELFPIQSDEADLLQGPEFSVACAAIVEAARKRTAEYVLLQLHMKPMSEIAAHWKERAETAEARLQSAEEVVKVLAAFVPYYAPWMDHHDDEIALSFYRPATFGDLRAAHRILSALQPADPTKGKDQ